MYRTTSVFGVLVLVLGLGVTACGDDGGTPATDANVVFIDAPIPDAPTPDAFVCNMTDCGNNQCVDLNTDPLHCGACNDPCLMGQDCVDMQCECPTVVAPANPSPLFAQVDTTQLPGTAIAFSVFSAGGTADALVLIYPATGQTTNMDIDISTISGANEGIVYGYNVDLATQNLQMAFIATAGTINYSYACDVGASATLTNVTFEQVTSIQNPTPVKGGCSFTAASIDITIGDPCTTADAGVGLDAGVFDAAP